MSKKRKYNIEEGMHKGDRMYHCFEKSYFWSIWKSKGFCFSKKTADLWVNELKKQL